MTQYTLTDNEKNILRLIAKGLEEKTVEKRWMPLYAYGKLDLIQGANSEISLLIASQVLQKPELVNLVKQGFLVQEPGQSENFILIEAQILEAIRTDFGALTQGKPVRLFISYGHEDQSFVAELHGLLVKAFDHVWYDTSILGGTRWAGKIKQEVADCTVFLDVLSTNSLNSEWCSRELTWAQEQGKFILPILIERDLVIPEPISALHFVGMTEGTVTVKGLNELYASVIRHYGLEKPQPRYILTAESKKWAQDLVQWWDERKIDQMFVLLDTPNFADPTDVTYGSGINDYEIRTQRIIKPAIVSELEQAGLVKVERPAAKTREITLLENLRQAVADDFR